MTQRKNLDGKPVAREILALVSGLAVI